MSKASAITRNLRHLSLGMSAAGLGLSTANFINSKHNSSVNRSQKDLQKKSLEALQAIHSTLEQQRSVQEASVPAHSKGFFSRITGQ